LHFCHGATIHHELTQKKGPRAGEPFCRFNCVF